MRGRLEKAGVSRSVGDRARMLVRERLANGEERSRDDVHNCQDPDSFDQEWQRAATHAQLHRLRGLEGLGGGVCVFYVCALRYHLLLTWLVLVHADHAA